MATKRKSVKRPDDDAESDKKLVGEIRQKIAYLCALVSKADRRGITVDFQIRKTDEKGGLWKVAQCDIRKKFG